MSAPRRVLANRRVRGRSVTCRIRFRQSPPTLPNPTPFHPPTLPSVLTYSSLSWQPASCSQGLSLSPKQEIRGSTWSTNFSTPSSNEPSFGTLKAMVTIFAPLSPTTWASTLRIVTSLLQSIGAMGRSMSACRRASTLPTQSSPSLSWFDFPCLIVSERQPIPETRTRNLDARRLRMRGFRNTALPSLYHIYTAWD